nr:MAG TPA: hypothetical protein [Caudoviricetes sp.]
MFYFKNFFFRKIYYFSVKIVIITSILPFCNQIRS